MPKTLPTASDISHVLVYFNVNAYSPDLIEGDMEKMSPDLRAETQSAFATLLDHNLLNAREYREATSCEAKSERSAREFFKAVYAYLYEDGELPDIDDY